MKTSENNTSAALSDPGLPSANIAMTQTAGFTETAAHQSAHSNEKDVIAEAPHIEEHSGSENVGPKTEPSKGATPITEVPLDQIRDDDGTQTRESINEAIVADYAERMTDGDRFPPIDLFQEGELYWVGDGFHRLLARKKMGCEEIEANIRPGGRIEALKHSLGANSKHGLQRTNADKRRAVQIATKEFKGLSSRQIAELCGVGHQLVETVRRELGESSSSESRIGKDKKRRRMPKKSAKKSTAANKNSKTEDSASSNKHNNSPNATEKGGFPQPSTQSEAPVAPESSEPKGAPPQDQSQPGASPQQVGQDEIQNAKPDGQRENQDPDREGIMAHFVEVPDDHNWQSVEDEHQDSAADESDAEIERAVEAAPLKIAAVTSGKTASFKLADGSTADAEIDGLLDEAEIKAGLNRLSIAVKKMRKGLPVEGPAIATIQRLFLRLSDDVSNITEVESCDDKDLIVEVLGLLKNRVFRVFRGIFQMLSVQGFARSPLYMRPPRPSEGDRAPHHAPTRILSPSKSLRTKCLWALKETGCPPIKIEIPRKSPKSPKTALKRPPAIERGTLIHKDGDR